MQSIQNKVNGIDRRCRADAHGCARSAMGGKVKHRGHVVLIVRVIRYPSQLSRAGTRYEQEGTVAPPCRLHDPTAQP